MLGCPPPRSGSVTGCRQGRRWGYGPSWRLCGPSPQRPSSRSQHLRGSRSRLAGLSRLGALFTWTAAPVKISQPPSSGSTRSHSKDDHAHAPPTRQRTCIGFCGLAGALVGTSMQNFRYTPTSSCWRMKPLRSWTACHQRIFTSCTTR